MQHGVVPRGQLRAAVRRDARSDAAGRQLGADAAAIMAAIADDFPGRWKRPQHHGGAAVIRGLACGAQEHSGGSLPIAGGVEPGGRPALGPAHAAAKSLLVRRWAAVRCALRCVPSVTDRPGGPTSATTAATMRSNPQIRLTACGPWLKPLRTKRLYSVVCGPLAEGASRHGRPLRIMPGLPLHTRRPAICGTPRESGNGGDRRRLRADGSGKSGRGRGMVGSPPNADPHRGASPPADRWVLSLEVLGAQQQCCCRSTASKPRAMEPGQAGATDRVVGTAMQVHRSGAAGDGRETPWPGRVGTTGVSLPRRPPSGGRRCCGPSPPRAPHCRRRRRRRHRRHRPRRRASWPPPS